MRLTASLALALAPLGAHAAENLEAALGELAAEVLSFVENDAPKKIAISTMIHGDGQCSDLSERASNRFQGALFRAKSPSTSVIDRRSLSAIFREQDLVEDGTVSPEGAAKIARIAQVDAIVTGTMTTYGDQVELEASMLDAVNGTVLGFAYSSFPLTGADQALLANRSIARCGFAGAPRAAAGSATPEVRVTVETPGSAAPASGAKFTSDIFEVEVVSLFYARASGEATFSLRLRNISDQTIALSYHDKTLSITDGRGGLFTLGDTWSGLRVCTNLNYCNGAYPNVVNAIAPDTQAQLTFNAAGAKDLENPVMSLTFELAVVPDMEKRGYNLVSVGFFDLAPTVR
jgi:hypothetical protein